MFPVLFFQVLPPLTAAVISAISCAILLGSRARLPQDAPNARSLHGRPVPRVGGLAIWSGFVPVAAWWTELPGGVFTWVAWCALLLVSLADDYRGVHPAARLVVHASAALVAAWGIAGTTEVGRMGPLLLIALAFAWSANAFNFMDGSDGLAALMAITGFVAYATGAGAQHHGVTYAALAAAVVPFAIVNAPPARLFMGDGGAVPLGFLAAVCGAAEWLQGAWPLWFPLLVFLPFAADATITLVRRLWRRERVWQAHRDHYYQRLHQLGAKHRGTLMIYGAVMVGSALAAILTLRLAPQWGWLVLAIGCAALAMLFTGIDYHWRRRGLS